VVQAMHEPSGYRADSAMEELLDGHIQLTLGPLALVRIDDIGAS
jgi:hypothetical protein